MRGIVAELNGKYAIILTQDGSFKKIKTAAYMTVGSEIDLNQPAGNFKVTRLITKVSSIAAAALLALGIGYGAYSYTVPYSYVDVDINPSIELTANVYDRIIKVEALNNDGIKLLNSRSLKNVRLEEGVSQLLNIAVEQGYLKAEPVIENAVLFTVSSTDGNKSGELKRELTDAASKELDRGNIKSEVLVGEASVKQRDDARKLGVTPGKLALIEDAMGDDPELKLEELKKAAVKDLVKKVRDKKAAEEKEKAAERKEKDIGTVISGKNTIEQNNETAQDDQGVKQEQTSVSGQHSELSRDMDEKEKTAQNDDKNDKDDKGDKGDKSDKSDKDNKSDNKPDNNNKKDKQEIEDKYNKDKDDKDNKENKDDDNSQDAADILEREKQQRQQLMDELLEQIQEREQEQSETQEEE